MLRDYQENAIANLRNLVNSGKKRVVLVLPTGGGKTIIAAQIAANAVAGGRRVGFFAHRVELLRQTEATFKRVGISRVGYIAAGLPEDADALAQVCSIDTFRNREKPPFDIIFVDEAHRSMAASYREHIFEAYPDACIFGLTATPERLDGKGLGDVYEDILVVATPVEMIRGGYIVKPRIFTAPFRPQLDSVRSVAGDYHAGDLEELMSQNVLVGNIVEHWRKHANNARTFVFASGVKHSKKIQRFFEDEGIPSAHLDGDSPKDERLQTLIDFEAGKIRVLSSCGLFVEGVDIPSARCAILARPTKSVTVFLQSVGRVLRPWHDEGSLILDHAGGVIEHGFPWRPRMWSLEGRMKRPKDAFEIRTCPTCFAVLDGNPKECPECSAELNVNAGETEEIKTIAGELRELVDETFDNAERDPDDPLGIFADFNHWRNMNAEQIAFIKRTITGFYYKGHKPGALHFRFMEKYEGAKAPFEVKVHAEAFFSRSDYWVKTSKMAAQKREYWQAIQASR